MMITLYSCKSNCKMDNLISKCLYLINCCQQMLVFSTQAHTVIKWHKNNVFSKSKKLVNHYIKFVPYFLWVLVTWHIDLWFSFFTNFGAFNTVYISYEDVTKINSMWSFCTSGSESLILLLITSDMKWLNSLDSMSLGIKYMPNVGMMAIRTMLIHWLASWTPDWMGAGLYPTNKSVWDVLSIA